MFRVEFENRYGKHRVIGTANTEQKAYKIVMDFLKGYNFTVHYTRIWTQEKGHTMMDVGSHDEFFHLYEF